MPLCFQNIETPAVKVITWSCVIRTNSHMHHDISSLLYKTGMYADIRNGT
jgi:hypothetical protein